MATKVIFEDGVDHPNNANLNHNQQHHSHSHGHGHSPCHSHSHSISHPDCYQIKMENSSDHFNGSQHEIQPHHGHRVKMKREQNIINNNLNYNNDSNSKSKSKIKIKSEKNGKFGNKNMIESDHKLNDDDMDLEQDMDSDIDIAAISSAMNMNAINVGNGMSLLMGDNFIYNDQFQDKQPKEKDEITVIVKNDMNKATLLFPMKKQQSMKDLKLKIQERLKINPNDQKLTFENKQLNDDDIDFGSGKFKDGDTINLNINVCALSVDIEVLGSDMIKDMRFWNNLSVKNLKQQLSERTGLMINDIILKYDDKEMNDDYYLYNYGVINGGLIKLNAKHI